VVKVPNGVKEAEEGVEQDGPNDCCIAERENPPGDRKRFVNDFDPIPCLGSFSKDSSLNLGWLEKTGDGSAMEDSRGLSGGVDSFDSFPFNTRDSESNDRDGDVEEKTGNEAIGESFIVFDEITDRVELLSLYRLLLPSSSTALQVGEDEKGSFASL
jgi:hypothetical protein